MTGSSPTAGDSRIAVITTRDRIRGVAASWKAQYGSNAPSPFAGVQKLLDALDKETATAEEVAAIIGNTSWTHLHCDVCDREVEKVVRVGEEPFTAAVCGDCLNLAVEAFRAE